MGPRPVAGGVRSPKSTLHGTSAGALPTAMLNVTRSGVGPWAGFAFTETAQDGAAGSPSGELAKGPKTLLDV
jgi:hypothetical protein